MDKIRRVVNCKLEYVARLHLQGMLIEWIQAGWVIVYVIPGIPIQSHPSAFFLDPLAGNITGSGAYTWTSGTTLASPSPPPEPCFEVYMIMYEEEDVPCPTCSHLNPERLDREA